MCTRPKRTGLFVLVALLLSLFVVQTAFAAEPPRSFNVKAKVKTESTTIKWKPSKTVGVTYELQQSLDGGATWTDLLPGPGAATSYLLVDLIDRASYSFRVRATDGTPSEWVQARRDMLVLLDVKPPAGFKVPRKVEGNTVDLLWKASKTEGATYELQVDTGGGFGASIFIDLPGYAYAANAYGNYAFQLRAIKTGWTPSKWVTKKSLVQPVGDYATIQQCYYCHISQGQSGEWLDSAHANPNDQPSNSFFGYPKEDCAGCHDPLGESAVIGTLALGSNSRSSRPVIGCESCHGPSAGHKGTNMLPAVPVPLAADTCISCHTNPTGHPGTLGDDVTASPHGSLGPSSQAKCQRCHSYEGSLAFAEYTGGAAVMNQMDTANGGNPVTALTTVTAPYCNACHSPHTTGVRPVAGWDPNGNQLADQFDACTSCHTLLENTGALATHYHNDRSSRIITDSHYDDPATGATSSASESDPATVKTIEGYNVRFASENPCADCHDPHTGDVVIQTEWANSAHAGKIAAKKDEAACAASIDWWNAANPGNQAPVDAVCTDLAPGSTRTYVANFLRTAEGTAVVSAAGAMDDADGAAWAHYNWDRSGRQSCQRCHTSTGVMNFLDDPVGYDPLNNDFSHLSGWTGNTDADGSPQNEMLYCWGCHSSASDGRLRDPGALSFTYTNGATASYPDVSSSNVCVACHTGRETGDSIKLDPSDGIDRGFINSHYLTAGGSVFATNGYEYPGENYDFGSHRNVGVEGALVDTGTSGPCATCHMSGPNPHTWDFLTKDAGGVITSNDSSLCAACHGMQMDAAYLEAEKAAFAVALAELETALQAQGIYFSPNYPYFYENDLTTAYRNWAGPYGTDSWKDVMGAAFNYNLLEHDPGSYAHNREYALKLIVDSIDFLDDGTVNGSAGGSQAATLLALYKGPHPDVIAAADETVCGQCHTAVPHYGGAVLTQAQFVVSTTAHTSDCADCHVNPAIPVSDINKQYAESGHGDVFGDPWFHYDWRMDSRASCQRCHTATGYIAKLGNETDVTPVFDGVATTGADLNLANETLRCNACHTDPLNGDLRTPGAYTATYSNGASQVFPDLGGSNLCVRCHGARESGDSIKNSAADFANVGFINSHYLAAGSMVFAGGGYQYDGQDYTYGLHQTVGIGDVFGTGNNGPCVSCHMGLAGTADHTWDVVKKDATGMITAINSDACGQCHGALTPTVLEEKKADMLTAMAALDAALQARGIYFSPNYPYFYADAAGTTALRDWTLGGTLDGMDVMGAAFNYNLMEHDPGVYAHNRDYALKLIADSIDFLEDGVVDGTPNIASEMLAAGITFGSHSATITTAAQADNQTALVACGTCHAAIAATVTLSKHTDGRGHNSSAKCDRCHTTEGYVGLADTYTGDRTVMNQIDTDLVPNFDPDQGPTCLACHDAAQGILREVAGWDPNGNGMADQFDMCTSCHNLKDADGTLYGAGPTVPEGVGTKEFYHNTSWYRVIATTHYDDPATPTLVEGYNVRATGAKPCFDCHSHDLRTNTRFFNTTGATTDYGPTLYTEWAQSGHGGGLLDAKVAAAALPETGATEVAQVMAAGSDGDVFAWGHYNWDDNASRGSCQKCHTATGFMNFANDPDNYVAANNSFSHLEGWTATGGSGQNELLYCWGCHSDTGTGALRMQGAYTADFTYNGQPVVYPDIGKSNTCVVCHGGRGNANDGNDSSRFAGHHAPTGGILFSPIAHLGYEYAGLDYISAGHLHPFIGGNTEGPCVSCHMSGTSHTFSIFTRDATGVINGLTAQATCDSCHGGSVTYVTVEEESARYQQAGAILLAYVANTLPNYTGAVVNQDNVVENDRGAFQNSKLSSEEVGAFAHNSQYAKRLIFDAIDWLDNGAIDGTISIDADSYPLGAEWFGAPPAPTGIYVASRPGSAE